MSQWNKKNVCGTTQLLPKTYPVFYFIFIVKNVFTEQVTLVPLSSMSSPRNTFAQVLTVEEDCHFSLQPAEGTSNTTLLNLYISGAVLWRGSSN